jgi:hypothetical protein
MIHAVESARADVVTLVPVGVSELAIVFHARDKLLLGYAEAKLVHILTIRKTEIPFAWTLA